MKLKDAVVLVTGANRGLGRALAQAAVDAGAKRVYATARDPKQLDELAKRSQDKIVPLALDITDVASIAAAVKRAADVTVLVNNAGVLASYNVITSSAEAIAQDFATNVHGTLAVTKAFLPALERAGAAGNGAIVSILSVASLANFPMFGAYSASKAASFSIAQALRAELAKKGISVHVALPGAIDTDMVKQYDMPKNSPEDIAKSVFEGVEQGLDEIATDPMSRDMLALWKRDPKEVERQLASMLG